FSFTGRWRRRSPLLPYTTLFRSFHGGLEGVGADGEGVAPALPAARDSRPSGGEFEARITHMGRSSVRVEVGAHHAVEREAARAVDRKSTRLNSSHVKISYAVFCL